MDYLAFFFAIKHSEIEWLEQKLIQYLGEPNYYIMAMETSTTSHQQTEGQHIHILATMSPEDYKKFSTVVIRKYKLCGKAGNGLGKQYGKVNVVRDQQKMLSYTVKDKNFRTNMPETIIQEALAKSFKKEEKIDEEQKLMTHIKQAHTEFDNNHNFIPYDYITNCCSPKPIFGFRDAAISVIEYFRKKHIETKIRYSLSRNQIIAYVNKYFLYETNTDEINSNVMYHILFSSHNV